MEKRLILAVALSMLIMLALQTFIAKPKRPPEKMSEVQSTQAPSGAIEPQPSQLSVSSPSFEEKEYDVETAKYILTFSNIGGSIKRIRLKDYNAFGSKEPLDLFNLSNPREYPFALSGISGADLPDLASYELKKENNIVTYSLKTKNLEISKQYILHNSRYAIELRLIIKNISNSPQELNYQIIGGAGIIEASKEDKRFIDGSASIDGKITHFKLPKNERVITTGIVSWTALKNKYFSIILKPFAPQNHFYGRNRDNELIMGVRYGSRSIQPAAIIEDKYLLYAGPSQASILKEFGYGFEDSINYGFFGGISKLLISTLQFINNIVHNWGTSIILLAILLNIVLFPLTAKSFHSMMKMQELQPQMEKLKQQYKDNAQKLNKEIMELYKKYKINPFSGCLPMLLQMPVFFALYQALVKSIELRNAGFLWIKDLSMPDAVPIPLSLPIVGNSINILPLIMVIGMVAQQKLSSASMGRAITDEQKQQQKMMLILMPIMFGFIFYNMPSGLVLYWVINTVLTTVEQAVILKKT